MLASRDSFLRKPAALGGAEFGCTEPLSAGLGLHSD